MKNRLKNSQGRTFRLRPSDVARPASAAPLVTPSTYEQHQRFARGLVMAGAKRAGVPVAQIGLAFGLTEGRAARIIREVEHQAEAAGCEVRDG
jgi:hypothetical protein